MRPYHSIKAQVLECKNVGSCDVAGGDYSPRTNDLFSHFRLKLSPRKLSIKGNNTPI